MTTGAETEEIRLILQFTFETKTIGQTERTLIDRTIVSETVCTIMIDFTDAKVIQVTKAGKRWIGNPFGLTDSMIEKDSCA